MRDAFEDLEAPTVEEAAAAERLRQALEEDGTGADGESVAAARLLQAVSGASSGASLDEVSAKRLRRELVARTSRRPLRRAALFAVAASIVAAFLLVERPAPRPDASLLARREAEARVALTRIAALPEAESVTRLTLASLTASRNRELFASTDSQYLTWSTSRAKAVATATDQTGASATPTPGGAS